MLHVILLVLLGYDITWLAATVLATGLIFYPFQPIPSFEQNRPTPIDVEESDIEYERRLR